MKRLKLYTEIVEDCSGCPFGETCGSGGDCYNPIFKEKKHIDDMWEIPWWCPLGDYKSD